MTKDQFEILLKAKNIIPEQAMDAIIYLKNCSDEDAIEGHYLLYQNTYNRCNYKVSNLVIASLKEYLPFVKNNRLKGSIYCIMAADLMNQENYSEVIRLYYEYKKLNIDNKRFDYNFDNFMFTLLATNKIYDLTSEYIEKIAANPFLYENDSLVPMTFFFNCATIYLEKKEMNQVSFCLQKLQNVLENPKSQDSSYQEQLQYMFELMTIAYHLLNAKTKQEQQEWISKYKAFNKRQEEIFPNRIYQNADPHFPILKWMIEQKDQDYVLTFLHHTYDLDNGIETKMNILSLLTDALKKQKGEQYYAYLEEYNAVLKEQLNKNTDIVKIGIINTIKYYNSQENIREIKERYEVDQLTGCFSRNVFFQKATELFEKSKKGCLIFFDLDNLKEVNDQYSHNAGDEYLRLFAKEIMELTSTSCSLFRFGGDEFILVCAENDEEKIVQLMESIIEKLSEPRRIYHILVRMNFSAGIALYPNHGSTIQEVLGCADYAMYEAKKSHLIYKMSRNL